MLVVIRGFLLYAQLPTLLFPWKYNNVLYPVLRAIDQIVNPRQTLSPEGGG